MKATFDNYTGQFKHVMFDWLQWPQYRDIFDCLEKCHFISPQLGDGVTMHYYTDAAAGTVIRRTATQVEVQLDDATLLTKPEFIPGGFAGHCINQRQLEYSYRRDIYGRRYKFTRRANGSWILMGNPMRSGCSLSMGRHQFYDYNF